MIVERTYALHFSEANNSSQITHNQILSSSTKIMKTKRSCRNIDGLTLKTKIYSDILAVKTKRNPDILALQDKKSYGNVGSAENKRNKDILARKTKIIRKTKRKTD